jgi:hypothetical protein
VKTSGDKRLTAYPGDRQPAPAIGDLRSFVDQAARLYGAVAFVFLEKLPLTRQRQSRSACVAGTGGCPTLQNLRCSQDSLELQLAKLWEKIRDPANRSAGQLLNWRSLLLAVRFSHSSPSSRAKSAFGRAN